MENKLGDFLKEKQGNLSLREFAKILDISHTYLDNLEKGYDIRTKKPVRITVDTLSKIAEALDEPLEKLVAFSKNEDYSPIDIKDIDIGFANGYKGLNDENKETLKNIMTGLLAKQKLEENNNNNKDNKQKG